MTVDVLRPARASRVRWLVVATVSISVAGCHLAANVSGRPTPPQPVMQPTAQVLSPTVSSALPAPAAPLAKPDFAPARVSSAVSTEPGPEGEPERDLSFYAPGTDRLLQAPGPKPSIEAGPGEITLNFENVNILEVVKVILGDLLGLNYLVDPRVQGTATLQTSRPISKDALLPTLETLLRMNGAALVLDGGLYNIVPREIAAQGLVAPQLGDSSVPLPTGYGVQIVPLEYISATEMQKLLEPFSSPGSILRVDAQRNLIVLAGASEELNQLLATIEVFDVDWLKGMSVALITPDFVDVATLSAELEQVFGDPTYSPWASLIRFVAIERLNGLLVITPRRQVLREVVNFAERLDRDPGTVGKRLFVYHVQNGKAGELASVLSQVFEQSTAASAPRPELAPGLEPVELESPPSETPEPEIEALPSTAPLTPLPGAVAANQAGLSISEDSSIRIIADEVNNALLIMGTAREYKVVREALRQLDIIPLQVLIEVTIAEITLDGRLEYGLEWFFKNNFSQNRQGVGVLDLGAAGLAQLTPGFSYAIADSAGLVRAVLNALARDSKVNIVSSPSLMVLNNQSANIEVGDQVPITTRQQQSTATDANVVNSIEYRDTGVLLTVQPRVNAGGLVIMEVEQEVSDVAETTADSLTPTIQQRRISSTVAVQSGRTVVLGGLIRENRLEAKEGVPGLYRLPVVGALFGATTNDQRRTELVVLITPRVVKDQEAARQITEEFRAKMASLRPLTTPSSGSTLPN